MSATKEQIQIVDSAVEEMIKKIQPIIAEIGSHAGLQHGTNIDCYMLKGWGLLGEGAHAINTAKALAQK